MGPVRFLEIHWLIVWARPGAIALGGTILTLGLFFQTQSLGGASSCLRWT